VVLDGHFLVKFFLRKSDDKFACASNGGALKMADLRPSSRSSIFVRQGEYTADDGALHLRYEQVNR
jgi:hypothetical protein